MPPVTTPEDEGGPVILVDTDADSLDEDSSSDTQSLTSTVQSYIYENGRRYHRYGQEEYALPNDETEQDRLDMTHHLHTLALDGELHTAPIDKSAQRILDIGTGTGIWAIEMAQFYPSAEVIGTDISPIQPRWVPPNCRFEVDDAESDWTWPAPFDFIHSRDLTQAIRDWSKYAAQMFSYTAPGGYVELVENRIRLYSDDNTIPEDSPLSTYYNLIDRGLEIMGVRPKTSNDLKGYLEDAGFVDVTVRKTKQPSGLWPKDKRQKDMGAFFLCICETGFEAYGLAIMTRTLGMGLDEAAEICKAAWTMAKLKSVHGHNWKYNVYGRKPEEV